MTLQVVHLRVNDAATLKPTPVRLRVTTPDGQYLPPLGRAAEFPSGGSEAVGGSVLIDGKAYAYIDGGCEIRLPSGPLDVEISKGPEYTPIKTELVRKTGQIALRLTIERACDLRPKGWYSGDTHAQFLSPAAACLEGAAEGLSVVNVLASVDSMPSLLDFSGQEPALVRQDCLTVVNTLNRGGALGDLSLLNAHRVIHPLELGAAGFEHYTLEDWCQQCHRKGGLVVRPRFHRGDEMLTDDAIYRSGIDAIEWTDESMLEDGLQAWYAKLNAGFRLPLVGGSGKRSNRTALGATRTYAQLEPNQALTYSAWIEAVRVGRTFATRGPLLRFQVNGKGPGRVLAGRANEEMLVGVVQVLGSIKCDQLELVRDGAVIATAPGSSGIEIELPRGAKSWLAGRGYTAEQLVVHSSPAFLA
jgi:hypothetical protein